MKNCKKLKRTIGFSAIFLLILFWFDDIVTFAKLPYGRYGMKALTVILWSLMVFLLIYIIVEYMEFNGGKE